MLDILVNIVRGLFGLAVLIALCYGLSKDRKHIDWRLVFSGIGLQLIIAVLVVKVKYVATGFELVSKLFVKILQYSSDGSRFIFGNLVDDAAIGAQFGFQVLPTIIFFSALTSMFYYLGILQRVVFVFAWVMNRTMRLSGAESMAAAANIFIGQTEAPLLVRPYLERMSRSELACLMTGGMATISGSVLAAYMAILGGDDPAERIIVGKRLLTASIMAAPAAIVLAKVLFPETKRIDTHLEVPKESIGLNLFDSITAGTTQGVRLAVIVAAILIVFIALIAMINYILIEWIGSVWGFNSVIESWTDGAYEGLSLQLLFGILFSPVAFIIGVDFGNLLTVGQLLGEKLVLNEFFAYITLGDMIKDGTLTDPKATLISTFALCGFANFASIGVQIGGISTLAPGQRDKLAKMALRALVGGTCATLMTATIVGAISG